MSWTDDEIDDLFAGAANEQPFEFKPDYFKDIDKQLPVNRSSFKPSLWWLTGGLFIVMFSGLGVVEFSKNGLSVPTANVDLNSTLDKGIVHSSNLEAPTKNVVKNSDFKGSLNPGLKGASEDIERSLSTPEKMNTQTLQGVKLPSEDILEKGPDLATTSVVDDSKETVLEANDVFVEDAVLSVNEERSAVDELPLTKASAIQGSLPELISSNTFASKANRIKFYAELTGGIEQGWTNNESGNSVNGTVGGRFGLVLPVSRFTLSAGLGVEAKKLNDLQIKERTKVYNFGYSTYEHVYQFSSIYSVHAPLSLSYAIKRHSFALGIDPSVNMFTRLNRSELLDDVQIADRSGISDVSLFSKFGASANVGYAYSVNENLQIGCRMSMQLIQPISSDRFYGTSVSKPIEGQVFIRRTLDF